MIEQVAAWRGRWLWFALAAGAIAIAIIFVWLRVTGVAVVERIPSERIGVAADGFRIIDMSSLGGGFPGWTVADDLIHPGLAPIVIEENGQALTRVTSEASVLARGTYRYDRSWVVTFVPASDTMGEITARYTAVPRYSLIGAAALLAVAFVMWAFAQPIARIGRRLMQSEQGYIAPDGGALFGGLGSWVARRPIRIGLAIAGPIWLAAWFTLYNTPGPIDMSASDFSPGAAIRLGIVVPPPDLLFTDLFSAVPGIGAKLQAAIAGMFGGDVDFAALLLCFSAIASMLIGAACVVWRLVGSPLPVFLLAFLYPLSWLGFLIVGYVGITGTLTAPTGIWAQGWAALIWGLWFALPGRGALARIPFGLAGLLVGMHPIVGGILSSILFGEIALRFLRAKGARAAVVRSGLLDVGVFVLGLVPFILTLSPSLRALSSASFDPELWWRLMLFRKPFHVYLWDGLDLAKATASIVIVLALWANLRRSLDRTRNAKIVATIGVVVAYFVVSYVVVALVPTPRLAGMVLSRAGFIFAQMSVMFLCALPWLVWRERDHRHLRLALALSALILSISTLPPWWAPSPRLTWIPVALIGVLLASALLGERGATWRPPRWLRVSLPAAIFALIALFVYQAAAVWGGHKASRLAFQEANDIAPGVGRDAYESEWRAVKTWLASNTRPDATLMLPPCLSGYFSPGLPRVSILSYAIIGSSVYNFGTVAKEADILRDIFGIDLRALDRDSIVRLKQEAGGVLALLDARYMALTADVARLIALKRNYPELRFVVTAKSGGYLPEFCSTEKSPSDPAALPVALATANLVIIDLEGL